MMTLMTRENMTQRVRSRAGADARARLPAVRGVEKPQGSVWTDHTDSDGSVVIHIAGKMDGCVIKDLRRICFSLPLGGSGYRVDFSQTTSVDSAGMAMLLLVREHLGGPAARMQMAGLTPHLRRNFNQAGFASLFDY